MQWVIGTVALLIFVLLAFRFAQSRRSLYATLAVFAIIAAAAGAFMLFEYEQNEKRIQAVEQRIKPDDVDLTDATFAQEYGRWQFRGTLVNPTEHRITGLTLRVTVQECVDPAACETVGEADASTVGIDVAPGETERFDLRVNLPDMATPRAMKFDYKLLELRAGRS